MHLFLEVAIDKNPEVYQDDTLKWRKKFGFSHLYQLYKKCVTTCVTVTFSSLVAGAGVCCNQRAVDGVRASQPADHSGAQTH